MPNTSLCPTANPTDTRDLRTAKLFFVKFHIREVYKKFLKRFEFLPCWKFLTTIFHKKKKTWFSAAWALTSLLCECAVPWRVGPVMKLSNYKQTYYYQNFVSQRWKSEAPDSFVFSPCPRNLMNKNVSLEGMFVKSYLLVSVINFPAKFQSISHLFNIFFQIRLSVFKREVSACRHSAGM